MSGDAAGEPLRIDNTVPAWGRGAAVLAGLAVIALTVWELWRGVWPPNIFSPFFLTIILGACSIGIPMIRGGIAGWTESWTISPGRIEIRQQNPFATRNLVFTRDDALRFDIVETAEMEGDNTWAVVLVTGAGRRHDTRRRLATRAAAGRFADEMRRAFEGA